MSSPDNSKMSGRIAIVTGASSGIGVAICTSLFEMGMHVVGVARTYAVIEDLAKKLGKKSGGSLTAMECDISDDEEVKEVFNKVLFKFGEVHCCINNAGIGGSTSLLGGTTNDWRRALNVNVVGLCLFTKLTVNSMKNAKFDDGHIIHISSAIDNVTVGRNNLHFHIATKQAVKALAEGLRQELRAELSSIRVSVISPGATDSSFAVNAFGYPIEAEIKFGEMDCLRPKDVADSVVHVLTAPEHVEIADIILHPTGNFM